MRKQGSTLSMVHKKSRRRILTRACLTCPFEWPNIQALCWESCDSLPFSTKNMLKQQSVSSNVLRHWVYTMSCFLSEIILEIHKWYLILLVCKHEVWAAGSYQAWYSVCRQQEVSIVSCRSVAYRRVYSGDNLMILSLYVTHSYVKMQCISDIES